MSQQQPQPARVLIIGGGYAGAVCAAELAAAVAKEQASATAATVVDAATTNGSAPCGSGSAAVAATPPAPPLLTITLVDPRDHLDAAFTHARSLVEPKVAGPSLLPFAKMSALSPVGVVRARVVALEAPEDQEGGSTTHNTSSSGKATLSDGSVLEFDYAVIATGSSYTFGKSSPASGEATGRAARLREIQQAAVLFAAGPTPSGRRPLRVLVVGGGPLGVEAAAELLTDVGAESVAEVTLVSASERLLPAMPARAGRLAQSWLLGAKPPVAGRCRLLLGRRVCSDDPLMVAADAVVRGASAMPRGLHAVGGVIVAEGGAAAALEAGSGGEPATVEYDVAIVATGIRRNTEFLAATLLKKQQGEKGRSAPPPVPVDACLRVRGLRNVFAAGDCTDVPEEKLAFLAAGHGELVARNIVALVRAARSTAAAAPTTTTTTTAPQPPPPQLREWKPSQGLPVAIVTLGRSYAIMCVGPLAAAGWLPTKLKSRNPLGFLAQYKRRFGMKASGEEGAEGEGDVAATAAR